MIKYQFSGHDSFICKHFWLKKGYDYVSKKRSFGDENAVIDLGVGKNMVTSIAYWLRSFGLIDSDQKPAPLAKLMFNDRDGYDPFIENIGTVWLLHYELIKTNRASIYSLFFNEFRRGRTDFTKDQLLNFVKRVLVAENQKNVNENTLYADINVFIRNYLKPSYKETKIDIEEDFSSLLIDLDLMKSYKADNTESKVVEWYQVENKLQVDLPADIVLFTILDNERFGKSVPFKDLLVGKDSPGAVFALSEEGLFKKIEQITKAYRSIIYTESAGVRELQFKKPIDKWEVLYAYYQD